jgi:hypothetical protein
MHKSLLLASLVLAGSLLLLFPRQQLAAQEDGVFSTQIFLTDAHLDPNENNQVIRAFVPTRSSSRNCLATLNDTNTVAVGTVTFCALRVDQSLGGVSGVLVSVFFPQPPSPGLTLSVTVHQDGARRYGLPVLCTEANGC